MAKKLAIKFIKSEFEKKGCKLLTTEYINNRQKLEYRCPEGHKHSISWSNWPKIKSLCLFRSWDIIASKRKLHIDFVRSSFEGYGFRLISIDYKNAHQRLDYICSRGHRLSITWADWSQGQRYECSICKREDKNKEMLFFVQSEFKKAGYKLLTDEYINNRQKLYYICPKGNKYDTTWNRWQQGKRCPCCNSKSKKTIPYIEQEFGQEGYILQIEDYINNKQKLDCICPKGHKYSITRANWLTGYRCPKCNNSGTSKQEQELIEFVKDLGFNIVERDKSVINPYELDIVIPDKKIAIEYCGLYWHSELMGKDRRYHLHKLKTCEKMGYRLLTIFEDEFLHKKEIVFSRLRNLLDCKVDNVVYGRQCVINEITTKQARLFCEENHLQGYSGSNVKLGLFYNDALVSIMLFSRPSIAKGSRKYKGNVWELNRFCSKLNYRVVGGASKLLKYFENNYSCDSIYSYADRRWSNGNLYTQIGFDFSNEIRPNYWYIKNNNYRVHRFALRKTKNDPKNITEWEIRKSQGHNRIWDCGNLKYEKVCSN